MGLEGESMRQMLLLLMAMAIIALSACKNATSDIRANVSAVPSETGPKGGSGLQQHVLLDFEQPNPPVE